MKTFINLILHGAVSFLSIFVAKKKGVYIFGCGNGKGFQGNPKYLYLHLLSETAHENQVFWSTSCKKTKDLLHRQSLPVVYKYSLRAFILFLRSEYLFIEKGPDDIYYLPNIIGRFKFIQTWHGVALKHIGSDAIMQSKKGLRYFILNLSAIKKTAIKLRLFSMHRYKIICSTSAFTKNILINAFQNNNVITTGYPRNDLFFRPGLSFEKISKKLKLCLYNKVWLYAPTYRDNYDSVQPLSNQDWKQLNAMLMKNNMLLLVKKHPLEKNIETDSSLENVLDVSAFVLDVQEILLHCDGLISDYSSISSDFSLKDKPIIFFTYDIDQYAQQCRGFYDHPLEVFPGPFAYKASDLIKLISKSEIWFSNPEYKKKYNRYRDLYNEFTDGKSIERVISALEK